MEINVVEQISETQDKCLSLTLYNGALLNPLIHLSPEDDVSVKEVGRQKNVLIKLILFFITP
jgi:hypothetical protein